MGLILGDEPGVAHGQGSRPQGLAQTNVSASPSRGTPPASRTSRARRIGALAGEAAMVDQHGGVDRAMEHGRAQAGEQRAAVQEDQVELAAEPGQGAGPGRSGEEVAGPGDGASDRQDGERWSSGASIRASERARPPSTTSSSPTSGRRPSSRASIGPVRSASTSTVRQAWRDSARARVRTRVVRPSARWQLVKRMTRRFCRSPALDQELGHPLEPVAPIPLQGQHDGRPLQLGSESGGRLWLLSLARSTSA